MTKHEFMFEHDLPSIISLIEQENIFNQRQVQSVPTEAEEQPINAIDFL